MNEIESMAMEASSPAIDSGYIMLLGANLLIAVIVLISMRYLSGLLSNVNARDELAEKDNPAFGIAFGGVILGVTIMLSGALHGEVAHALREEIMLIAWYGGLGLALMSLTRYVFDYVSLPKFSVRQAVLDGNIAAAIIDAGNVISTAIILRAIIIWTDSASVMGIGMVLTGYALSQLLLTFVSVAQIRLYRRRHKSSLQEALREGKIATAWHFIGYRIGAALAITAASAIVVYDPRNVLPVALAWFTTSAAMMLLIAAVTWLAEKAVLAGIDLRDEIDNQQNVGISVAQAGLTIAVGILIAGVMV